MSQLALFGGSPVSSSPRGFQWPPADYAPGELVANYIDAGLPLSIPGRSGVIASCEDLFRNQFQRKHALLCSSGTMALYSAYFALGIQPGDEIICTNVTYQATCSPALHLGARIVFCDVESDTGNLSVEALKNLITPKTRCLATNAMWGHALDQDKIRQLCDKHNILWVEDFSHAHLAEYHGKPVGSFGDIACASLQGPKLISGGEAGVLLTDNEGYYEQAVLLGHNLHRSKELVNTVPNHPYAPLERTGYGLKLRCHPLAALLIEDQLKNHAHQWVAERADSLMRLSTALGELDGVRPPVIKDYVTSMGAWYGYKPWIDCKALGVDLKLLVKALQAEGLDVKIPRSDALNQLALFDPERFTLSGYQKSDNTTREFPNSDLYHSGILSLPTPTGPRDELILQDLIKGFQKVWEQLESIRNASHRI